MILKLIEIARMHATFERVFVFIQAVFGIEQRALKPSTMSKGNNKRNYTARSLKCRRLRTFQNFILGKN